MRYYGVWILAIMSFFSCHGTKKRLLAVGGIHVFEGPTPCKLKGSQPEAAVKNLAWEDTLAVEALNEGTAEVTCGNETINLDLVAPARLDIKLVDGEPSHLQKTFKVQVLLYDSHGGELEVGKFTVFDWKSSGELEMANDRSAGEFGICDTCYGMQTFRGVKAGSGSIEVRLGSLRGTLTVAL